MKKVTLFGQATHKKIILEWLQELGCIQLLSLTTPTASEGIMQQSQRNYEALRYLVHSPEKRSAMAADTIADLERIVEDVIGNRERRRHVIDRIDVIEHSIQALEPWGDFKVPSTTDVNGLMFWFYEVPLHRLAAVGHTSLAWQVVNRDQRCAYVVVVAPEEPAHGLMPVERAKLPDESLSDLQHELAERRSELEKLDAIRRTLTRWREVLLYQMVELDNRIELEAAATHTEDDDALFVARGWMAADSVAAVEAFAAAEGVAVVVEDPAPGDAPPVMLENPKAVAAGEELVGFFQLPGYDDWDPSAIIFVSFALFFAMIFSDAGYGAVFGLGVLALYGRLGRTEKRRRLRSIGLSVTAAAIVYGVLVGSYFGVAPPPGSLLEKLKVLEITDFDSMMKLCIVIGALHVIVGNAMTARTRWGSARALPPIGWIATTLGGMTLYLTAAANLLAYLLLAAGGLIVLAFSGDRSIETPGDVVWRVLDGLKGLTGITTVFGDILSYLRLFALGLASASLALTFNQLAGQMIEAVPGLGLLLAILIVVFGHALNVLLCVLGGLVHGLRLNLIEFYHWSVYGEGVAFRPFRKKESLSWNQ